MRVLARQQREAGVVLDRPLRQLRRGRVAQLDVHVVAHILHRHVVADLVLHLQHEVDQRMLRSAFLGQRQLAAPESSPPPARSTPRDSAGSS